MAAVSWLLSFRENWSVVPQIAGTTGLSFCDIFARPGDEECSFRALGSDERRDHDIVDSIHADRWRYRCRASLLDYTACLRLHRSDWS